MRRIVATGAAALALLIAGACGAEDGPGRLAPPASTAPAPSPGPSRTDPAVPGCAQLRGLGMAGTAEQYRAAAAVLAGTGDAMLARTAVRLHDATLPAQTRLARLDMLDVVLDALEDCLRVTG